jgi:hypothetical protein
LLGSLVGFAGIALGTNASDDVPRPVAALIAASAFVLIAVMIQRWARYFAGWIGYGVLNGLLMASTGHILNNPAILVKRSYALEMTGLIIVSVLSCLRFTEGYELHVIGKLALLTWLLAFTVSASGAVWDSSINHRYVGSGLRVVVAPLQTKTPPSPPTA